MIQESPKIIRNPCMGVCALDEKDICIACRRSGIEIAEWGVYSTEQKIQVLQNIEKRYAEEVSKHQV